MSTLTFDGFNLHDGTTYRVTAAGSAPGKPAPLRHVTAAFPGAARVAVVPRPPGPGSITLAIAVTGDLATGTLGANLDALLKVLHARPREPRWLTVTLGTSARRVLAVPTMVDVADLLPMLARVTVTFATDGYWESTAWSSSVQTGALSSLVALGLETGNAYGHRLSLTPGGNAPTTPRVLLCVQSGSQTPTRFTLRSLYTSPQEASSLSLSLAAGNALAWDPYLQSCVSLSLTNVRGWWPLAESGGVLRDFSSGSRDLTPYPYTLTLSGNEITDTVRAAGTQGDGRSADSSMGIWPASTNLAYKNYAADPVASGSFGDTGGAGATRTSLGSGRYRLTGGSGGSRLRMLAPLADLTNGASYAVSLFYANRSGTVTIDWCDLGYVALGTAGYDLDLGGGVHRAYTSGARATYDATYRFFDVELAAGAQVDVWWAQIEAGYMPTPYIASASARAKAHVTMPVALLNETQGWIALRLRPGWGSTTEFYGGAGFPVWFGWGTPGGDYISLHYREPYNQVWFDRLAGGGGGTAAVAHAPTIGTPVTIVCAWTATAVKLSIGGAAFTSAAATAIPSLSAISPVIGGWPAHEARYAGDILWAATGTGTLTDADAAALAALGNTDPTTTTLPSTAALTAVWPADTSSFTATAYTYLQDGPLLGAAVPGWPALAFAGTFGEFTSASADFNLSGHITVGAWLKADAIGALMGALGKATTNAGFWFGLTAAGLLTGGVGSGAATRSATGTTTLQAGRWYHAVLVWDATAYTVTLYLDGEIEAVATGGALTVGGYSGNFTVGSAKDLSTTVRYWNGKLAEPFVLNTTLTQTQVRNVYQRGLVEYNPTRRQPVGWPWPPLHGESASATNGYEIRVTHASTAPDIRAALAWHPAYTSA